jgi:hypothetical protein
VVEVLVHVADIGVMLFAQGACFDSTSILPRGGREIFPPCAHEHAAKAALILAIMMVAHSSDEEILP